MMIYVRLIGLDYFFEVSNVMKIFLGKVSVCQLSEVEVMETEKEDKIFRCVYDERGKSMLATIEGEDAFFSMSLDELTVKECAKITMYKLLSSYYNRTAPWGVLTGIRPMKMIHGFLREGKSQEEITRIMKSKYLVEDHKIELALEIAEKEGPYLSIKEDLISIYIGIPFCPSRCYYCSFASNSIEKSQKFVGPYLQALFQEMEAVSQYIEELEIGIETLYIGGGTPTALNEEQFERLLRKASDLFGKGIVEFTCEAGRPDSITVEKLKSMKKHGVTRISINPQTMNDQTLKTIGRNHSSQDIIRCFGWARELGFDNINMDLILGLEGEELKEFIFTLHQVFSLEPESITLHALAIKQSALLDKDKHVDLNQHIAATMLEMAEPWLRINDMSPYYLYRQKHMVDNLENIGYCKEGKECIYNIQVIEEKQNNIAFGADSVSKLIFHEENRIERCGNPKDLSTYIEKIDKLIKFKIDFLNTLYRKKP